jgi:SAM-dependent methyltransferase
MNPTTPSLPDRLFDAAIGTLELYSIYLGNRLGLYLALRERGALTPVELAEVAGIDRRYAREWLEQQAVAGLLEVDDARSAPDRRRYSLPSEHVGPLCDAEHGDHLAPFAQMLVGIAGALPAVVDAYRTGGGVPYAAYGHDFHHGQGGINRPAFTRDLVDTWLPAIPSVHDRLSAGTATIADIGCGHGWSTIALARAYPRARVIGVDSDAASIEAARGHAAAAGVACRFVHGDAAAVAGELDVALVLETLHDLARPVETLASLRRALRPGGEVIVVDERVTEEFAAPGDKVERMMYGWSVSHCLPSVRVEPDSAALGTVLRPGTVRELAERAGFAAAEVLPIDNLLFRFYRLR